VAYALAASLLLALASLALARYITSPWWLDALLASAGFAGLSAGLALGLVARRLGRRSWKATAAFVLAAAAALARRGLLAQLQAGALQRVSIDFPSLALAACSVVWGALALIWGCLAVSEALEQPRGAAGRRLALAGGALAVSGSLYSLAPLGALLGLRLNLWSFVGLFLLACLAYGLGAGWRWLTRRRGVRS
jgi:hypothetical protein